MLVQFWNFPEKLMMKPWSNSQSLSVFKNRVKEAQILKTYIKDCKDFIKACNNSHILDQLYRDSRPCKALPECWVELWVALLAICLTQTRVLRSRVVTLTQLPLPLEVMMKEQSPCNLRLRIKTQLDRELLLNQVCTTVQFIEIMDEY